VQGRLKKEIVTVAVESECACCKAPIRFKMSHDLSFTLSDPESNPLFFVPMVDFAKLRAPSIVDDF
jgi:hypothetical protein